ncbi:MAG: S-adenosylmethionine decarboxylase family protein [Gemmatimonadales bacterium]
MVTAFDHLFADLGGVPGGKLGDTEALSAVMLAAANAAGLSPAQPPVVKSGPHGVSAMLLCLGGHVAIHAVPDDGICHVDVASFRGGSVQRSIDLIAKRLGARETRTDHRRRGLRGAPQGPEPHE